MERTNRKRTGQLLLPSPTSPKRRRTASLSKTILVLNLNELGIRCLQDGRVTEANVLFQESLGCINQGATINCKFALESTGPKEGMTTAIKESEYDEGMHSYRNPLSLQNNRPSDLVAATLLYNVGLTLIRLKNFEKARLSFLQALELVLKEPESSKDDVDQYSEGLDRVKIYHNLGYCYYRNGHRQEAMHFYIQAMLQVKTDSDSMFDLAVACNCLAMLHLRDSNCSSSDCLDLLRTSLTSFCGSTGTLSPEVATVLFNMGQAHFYRAEYTVALTCFQEALKIRTDHLGGEESIDAAICIFGIGQCFHKQGHLEDAMAFFTKFLEIRESHGVLDHQDAIAALNSIAVLYKDKGEVEKAYSVFEKALVVGLAAFGGRHPNMASTLISFGSLCFQMAKFETALKLYEECLKIQKETLEPNHSDTINTLLNIAQIHWHVGRYQTAWTTFKEILTMQVQSIGALSLPVASTVSSMALIYCQMQKYEDALELYQEALRIRRDCYEDQDHPDIVATMNTVGLVLCKYLHEFKLAKETFQACLESRIRTIGVCHLDVSMLMHNLAAVHLDLGEEEDAIDLLDKALRIRKQKLGPHHPEVASTLHHLGQAYQIRGQLEEAADCFQQGLAIEKNNGKNDTVIIRKLLNLIGNIHLMRARIPEMMDAFVEASRIEEEEHSDFRTALLVTGHNFFDLSRLHPQSAPAA